MLPVLRGSGRWGALIGLCLTLGKRHQNSFYKLFTHQCSELLRADFLQQPVKKNGAQLTAAARPRGTQVMHSRVGQCGRAPCAERRSVLCVTTGSPAPRERCARLRGTQREPPAGRWRCRPLRRRPRPLPGPAMRAPCRSGRDGQRRGCWGGNGARSVCTRRTSALKSENWGGSVQVDANSAGRQAAIPCEQTAWEED